MPQHELHRRKSRPVAALRDVVQLLPITHDARKRLELGGRQRALIDEAAAAAVLEGQAREDRLRPGVDLEDAFLALTRREEDR